MRSRCTGCLAHLRISFVENPQHLAILPGYHSGGCDGPERIIKIQLSAIPIRDPFVLPLAQQQEYLLFGTTDPAQGHLPGLGFYAYRSRNLQDWTGPIPAFRPPADFWATTQFWAPEVHRWGERYYMLASLKSAQARRGTQIFEAAQPEGPYTPWSAGPVTPPEWECLDGTLHVDAGGAPWMVFCHEWVQIGDGAMVAVRLSPDLRRALGPPVKLFTASQAPWAQPLQEVNPQSLVDGGNRPRGTKNYVTDGPFLHRTADGSLLMLWSSFGTTGYALGIAESESGTVLGPWHHQPRPLWSKDGGHGMLFRTFDGMLLLALHQPNKAPTERATFQKVKETSNSLQLA